MENIKKFGKWKSYMEAMKAPITWGEDEDAQIFEGKMSNLDVMAQEAETFEEFVEEFKLYIEEKKIDMEMDEETMDWLQDLYDAAKSH
jgi:hypothetical protein